MYKPPQQAFSPHISRGYTAQQNSQPVLCHRLRTGSGRAQDDGCAPEAVCPLRTHHSSDEDGVDRVQEAEGPPGVREWERHIHLSWIDPLLDEIASGVLGNETQDSQKTFASHQEIALAMVSQQSSRTAAIPIPDALCHATRALSILRYSGELPPARGGPSFCGAGVAVLVESAQ